jgi:outer membrane protein OmpA-like peptidoglycan-associated protein
LRIKKSITLKPICLLVNYLTISVLTSNQGKLKNKHMKTTIITTSLAALFLVATITATKSNLPAKEVKTSANAVSAIALAELTKNLEYDNAKPSIRKAYYANLDKLAKAVKDDNYAVSLRGHADSIGQYKYNWMLSDDRAVSVKKYLVSKGVQEDRIVTTPFGSTVPIASNKTLEGRQKNRRVEIELKKVK